MVTRVTKETSLYADIVKEHGQRPRNVGVLAERTHEARADNPLCGDRVTLHLRVEDDRVVAVRFESRGCMIARASASLLTEVVAGQSTAEALERVERLFALVDARAAPPADAGALEPFRAVREFPARRTCATLAWDALRAALAAPSTRAC
jgi:nitrogen fixation protein NifU and related proteins